MFYVICFIFSNTMFIVLDLETTGLSPREDTIIECAFIKINRETFREESRFTTYINPEREIPGLISQITNIFHKDVEDAPIFEQVLDEIQDFIEWFPLIWHNVSFDIRFLESHGVDCSKNPPIDTFFLANFLCYKLKSLNLGYLCESFDIKLDNAHRAIDDALATVLVFQKLIEKLQSFEAKFKEVFYYYFSLCQDTGVRILRDEYLKKWKKLLWEEDIVGSYILGLKKNYSSVEKMSHTKDAIDIQSFLDEIDDFEVRDSQKQMLSKVDETFQKWKRILIEAPTGIWKTFAYLLPALKYSLRFNEAVHISTSTKALQDQIYYKDLTFLREVFPHVFSFTKLKWKRNYLWVSSFLSFLESAEIQSPARIGFILKIYLWSLESDFGELDELDYYGEEWSYLSDINAWDAYVFDAGNIYKESEFAFRARKRAKQANIVVTNNHILFQDMSSEWSLLWGVKNLVLDEAHSLEDIVTNSLKKTFSFQILQKTFQKIEKKIWKYKISDSDILTKKQHILFDCAELFSVFEGAVFEKFSLDAKYKSLSLKDMFFEDRPEVQILDQKIILGLKGLQQDIANLGDDVALLFSRELQEINFMIEFLWNIGWSRDCDKYIYYLSHDNDRGTQIHYTLLRPWSFLDEYLWSRLESVVLTSATLQMGGSFWYIQKMLQVEEFETLTLDSDFDYKKQALVFIPQDLGSVKHNLPQVLKFLEAFFFIVRGQTLVLFTAFSVIREVFSTLKIRLQQDDIHLLAQSISGSKNKQIDFFKAHSENSILLWTDTFWEGIDIPGRDLRYLVIHKIPFSVPSDPIFTARSSLFQDSFADYAIPKSILKLKQGFGRLVRSKDDTGIIVFLDDRINTTIWGKKFFEAFPKDIKVRYWSTQKLIELLQGNT